MKSDLLNRTRRMLRVNSPQILSGFAVAGVVTTAYYAVKGSFQAAETIQLSAAEDESIQEKAKLVWPHYIPTAVAGTITIGCIVSANSLHGRRAAAAVSAYTITEQAFSEYRAKVREELGNHKEQVLRDDIARNHVESNPASKGVIIAGDGNVLCNELYTGRYFMSNMENLRKAENDINSEIVHGLYATLDSFYDQLGLPHTSTSGELGWDSDRLMELEFSTVLSDDGKPCLAFQYNYIKPI